MASGVGTKSRAPSSTSSINFGICCVISNDCNSKDGIPEVDNALYVGSVMKLVNDSRTGLGIEIRDGVSNVSRFKPGGFGSDWISCCNASSDGTLPI